MSTFNYITHILAFFFIYAFFSPEQCVFMCVTVDTEWPSCSGDIINA